MVSINESFLTRTPDQVQNGQRSLHVRSFWVSCVGLSIGFLSVYFYVSINLSSTRKYLRYQRPWLQVIEWTVQPWRCKVSRRSQFISNLAQTVSPPTPWCEAANIVTPHSFIVRFLRKVPDDIKRGMKHLEPLIMERIEQERQYGDDWQDKPVSGRLTWCFILEIHPILSRMMP